MVVAIWEPLLKENCIFIYSDNAAVICALTSRLPEPLLNHGPPTLQAAGQQTRLDISLLERAVQGFFSHGLAQSSKSSYSTAQRHYASFGSHLQLSLFPYLRKHCIFAAYLANQGFESGTITSTYLASGTCRMLQAFQPLPQTHGPGWLHYVRREIKRSLGSPYYGICDKTTKG
uniref:Uncharacterized protein n=1 Tax=Amphimedon queenslandica TaxID=400682 RepID=A0A1X7VDA1_AMPQE